MDYEEMILARQDSEMDDCKICEYRQHCKNQCEQIHSNQPLEEVYPILFH